MNLYRLFIFLLCFPFFCFAKTACFSQIKNGDKAWQVVAHCGKPLSTMETKKTTPTKQYQIFTYSAQEPLCYTTFENPAIICESHKNTSVVFYFNKDILTKMQLKNIDVNHLFLRYHQKIVLGDTISHLTALWGQPLSREEKNLSLPSISEIWSYPDGKIIFENGLVISKNINKSAIPAKTG